MKNFFSLIISRPEIALKQISISGRAGIRAHALMPVISLDWTLTRVEMTRDAGLLSRRIEDRSLRTADSLANVDFRNLESFALA